MELPCGFELLLKTRPRTARPENYGPIFQPIIDQETGFVKDKGVRPRSPVGEMSSDLIVPRSMLLSRGVLQYAPTTKPDVGLRGKARFMTVPVTSFH